MIWYADGFSDVFASVPDHVTLLFGLVLNPMRGHTEETRLICISDLRSELELLVASERVEPYGDPGQSSFGLGDTVWRKSFRRGGPLEWYNPPEDSCYYGTGIVELRRDAWRRVA